MSTQTNPFATRVWFHDHIVGDVYYGETDYSDEIMEAFFAGDPDFLGCTGTDETIPEYGKGQEIHVQH